MSNLPTLNTNDVADVYVRENFKSLKEFLQKEHQLLGFKFLEITVPGAVTNYAYPHGLGFVPSDIIETSRKQNGSLTLGTLTWNYASFDQNNLNLTTTGALVVRLFVGSVVQGDL